MILRKPYAILIKYFKVIHILMFVSFGYLVFALRKIYVFFSSYIKTSNFTYFENMSSIYVPWFLFFIVIILLGLAIGILLLMNKKEKPVLFYKIMIGFCAFLLIFLIYFLFFFKSLDNTVYENLRIVANRDLSLFAYIINFFFVGFTFIRGFGFDIKKFSFDKDKKELNLEESDSEEYELNVNIEKDDIKSFLNRQRRELLYYVKENKTILSIIGIIIVISLGLYFYYDIFVINRVYKEKDDIYIGGLTYRINSSKVSSVDKYGREMSSTDDYLIINLDIINNEVTGYLDKQALRVHIGENYYYPQTSICDMFSDYGSCYKNQELKLGTDNNYIIVYKIKKDYDEIFLEILKNKADEYQYSKVKLSYTKDEIKDLEANLNEEFEINNNKITIKSYSILERETYNYQDCILDKCNTYIKRIIPNTGEVILALELDDIAGLSDDFLSSAFGIKYNDKVFTGKDIEYKDKNNNYIYYSVPSFLKNTDDFTLLVTTRNTRYNIILKGE